MKKVTKSVVALSALAFMAIGTACNEVPEGNRYLDLPPVEGSRNVLLTDFTGQNCVNCPEGHEILDKIVEQYNSDPTTGDVIAVSVHCGDFGIPVERTNFDKDNVGLMTAEGQALCDFYGITLFPMGSVDFGQPIDRFSWGAAVRTALGQETIVTIPEATATLNSANNEIEIKASVLATEDMNAQVQFWIVEDGIVARQKDANGTVMKDYVHNNVFRAQVFPGYKGQDIKLTKNIDYLAEGTIATRWTEKEHWVVENLGVVIFVSNGTGTLNVIRVPLTLPEGE